MIDLHTHTSASDGRLRPAALVRLARASGLSVLGISDHDTTVGLAEARDEAARSGLRLVDGIEITAVEAHRDVHVLGYFIDPGNGDLAAFLSAQRADRLRRVEEIGERLAALNVPVVLDRARTHAAQGRTVGRPQVADALVSAGHAADRRDAFDRFLGHGRQAFVRRRGPTVAQVIDVIRAAGGLASLAHPGLTSVDGDIPRFAQAGLAALEVRHSDHDAELETHYRSLAATLGLAVSGGSDFHGDPGHHAAQLGLVTLPEDDFAALESRVGIATVRPRT